MARHFGRGFSAHNDHFNFNVGGSSGFKGGWGNKFGCSSDFWEDFRDKMEARFFEMMQEALERWADFTTKFAEKTGNFDPLVSTLEKMDALEAKILDAENEYAADTLAELRQEIDAAVEVLNENNIFREAPKFDAGHIDWILGQNLSTFQEVTDANFFTEGNIDYFNVNTGGRDNLYGEGFQGAGGNNVNASLQAATAGSTMTIGIEFRSYDGRNISGVEALDAMWKEYEARLAAGEDVTVLDIVSEISGGTFEPFSDHVWFGGSWNPAQFELQADSILSFAELLRDQGSHIGEIHVRPGYEFDADFNASADISGTAAEYINSFKLIAELLKGEDNFGLNNVQMVWQSQSGAERSPLDIYDEANGAEGPITEEDVYAHLDAWYPGDDYVDIVGMSFFQTEESANSWSFADGEANDGLATMDDFDVFLQAFANYARDHGKKLDISESTPAGAYLDRDQFNEIVQVRLDELGPDYDGPIRLLEDGEIAYAKFHVDTDPDAAVPGGTLIDRFFDESDPLYYISTAAQVWNEYFVPFFQYVERNADVIDSINMISYNWDEIPVFNSLETEALNSGIAVNFGSGNWWENEDLAELINDYAYDVFA